MLEVFKDIHKDETAIIVCNGPDLNWFDVKQFGYRNREVVFALNRGYLKKDLNYKYLITADKRIENHFADEIINSRGIKFCHGIDSKYVVQYKLGQGKFSTDIAKGMKLGHSVTVVALQIAYYMGIDLVFIVGMNHEFNYDNTKKHKGNQFSNKEEDKNHFAPDYYPPNYVYRYQNLGALENSYLEARKVYEADNRLILNASADTRLPKEIIKRTYKLLQYTNGGRGF